MITPTHAFTQLSAEIAACERCPRLREWCTHVALTKRRAYRCEAYWGRPVPGYGDPTARMLVVGLAPGAHGANRTGRLFTGDSSGDFLYGALHRAGFANQAASRARDDGMILTDAYVTAVCRCAPPDNRPSPEEIGACLPFLAREIALLQQLRVVVALGNVAFDAALRLFEPLRSRPVFAHGASYEVDWRTQLGKGTESPALNGRMWLIASYHPSRQNTQTGRLTAAMFDRIWELARSLL
jgi:uracil-DNA glycosylase family 4